MLERLLEQARGGAGQLAYIEGAAGIGKTRLLAETQARAEGQGFEVVSARGGEIERGFAFGIVRQLFEPLLAHSDVGERDELTAGAARFAAPVFAHAATETRASDDLTYAVLHGLYWLVANLADRVPLLVVVDDAHWADQPSLRFLLFLAHRLTGLGVLVLLAARPGEPGVDRQLLGELAGEATGETIQPRPLSLGAVSRVVRGELGDVADDELCAACDEATRGNPFLLTELLRELKRDSHAPEGIRTAAVKELGPQRISTAVLKRLGRLPEPAPALARAVAVLGQSAQLRHAAALTGIEADEAGRIADALADAAILEPGRPLRFVHPIVRAAIHRDLSETQRASTHRRAARILAQDGAEPEALAPHLLACEPAGDEWVVGALRDAAGVALSRAAPETAVVYLRRAVSEPPAKASRADLLLQLGSAAHHAGDPGAVEYLEEALSAAVGVRQRAAAALELGRALNAANRSVEAVEVFDEAILALAGADEALGQWLEAELISTAWYDVSTQPLIASRLGQLRGRVEGATAAQRLVLANLAIGSAASDEAAGEVAELARRALGGSSAAAATSSEPHAFYLATLALVFADGLALADLACERVLNDARSNGSAPAFAIASCVRSLVAFRRGSISDAEANARSSLDAAALGVWPVGVPLTVASLVDALVEQGQLAACERELERPGLDALLAAERPPITVNHLLHSRGRLRLAQGAVREGLDDLLLCGRRWTEWGIRNPAIVPWRSSAALALARLGDKEEARRLAAEELALARSFGSPPAIGLALRVAGVLEGGAKGVELLSESVELLEASTARVEHAYSLATLGAALRRAGQRVQSRERLTPALDVAHRCGASALAESARQELVVAGARPRRPRVTGRDALTPSELRIATMAAEDASNPAIAQALFVTRKTVEMHLGNVYRKLGIRSRAELTGALVDATPEGSPAGGTDPA